MNVAHYFTFLRIVIIPFFPLFYLKYEWFHIDAHLLPYVLLLILGVCEISDVVDGFLARKRNLVTDAGKVLDPMADSITHILVFFTLTQGVVGLPILLVFVFLYREFLISTLRTLCALKGVALAARKSGKAKAAGQAAVNLFIVALLIPFSYGHLSLNSLQSYSFIASLIAAIYTIISGADYVYSNWHFIKKAFA